MRLFYTLGIYLYVCVIRLVSLFDPKAKKWLEGRRDLFLKLEKALQGTTDVIWFHCASLGEFEQGRPLIEKIKQKEPHRKILLTFFSPSGYEVRKDYSLADFVFYMPSDTPSHVHRFLEIVKPSAIFIVKYEFWYNFLIGIEKRKIPTYLVSGIFREDQHFFKWYGTWFRQRLRSFSRFYLQDETSVELLRSIGFSNVLRTGDTRFDRVAEIAAEAREIPMVKAFAGDKPLLVAGSTWDEDLRMIASLPLPSYGYKLIVAPHETDSEHIKRSLALFPAGTSVLLFSNANPDNVKEADVLLIDNVGMLSALYRYGSLAFIGGGFGDGIHNILEASVYGLPVIFGPNHTKFSEALDLIRLKGAFCVQNTTELKSIVDLLCRNRELLGKTGSVGREYVVSNAGASDRILADAGFR
ncbi:MAG TPA: glycosyltransferase N-terminal domain-containing protein [Bacteroidia bacterium]|jgi:3-deoxy-D-manno-octulosonic-acid transferase|nr:glycosyltransferase N-terminal domain-containing protein [Bacteroidia bacterium]